MSINYIELPLQGVMYQSKIGMFKRLSILLSSLLLSVTLATAQISFQNIQTVKVDQLSDTQIAQFIKKYTEAGYTMADVERMAVAKNMPASELEKLKARINSMETSNITNITAELIENPVGGSMASSTTTSAEKEKKEFSRVFGSSLFSSSKLSFEPNQNMATPRNYVVGVSDVLHVDVFGWAEATYDLTVSAEGSVRIPNVGIVQVSGLTIEEAEKVIKKRLSSLYSSIHSGQTSVAVTVNKIRSIKVYILGEVRNPGSYTLSSVSSVFNALNACGGPSEKGTMRAIKLIRGGKEIASVDLYEFLMKGAMPSDVSLQDQDVIQVSPYLSRITVNGEVKRDGIYELKSGESLQDLINYCGGFTDEAYTERVSVTRNIQGEKSVADVTKEVFQLFTPASGDVYQVDKILEKYTNRVQILGSVFRPGVYALENGMSLRDLVNKANGVTEDAFMQNATLVRLQDDLTPEIISFSVKDLIDGNFNVQLKKEDVITIGGKSDYEQEKKISIYGAVLSPGEFPYYENVTLKDLVFLARGFKDEADPTSIEVVRRVLDENVLKKDDQKTMVFNLKLNRDLTGADAEFKLEPRDQVTVRKLEGYERLGVVQVLGEVRMPGTYVITRKTEKISDAIARASGITEYAYPEGAFLLRFSHRSEAERQRDLKLINMIKEADDVVSVEDLKKELETRQDLVGIQLKQIIKHPGSETDLHLEDGDVIFVPKELQTITIAGAVQVPGKEVYNGNSVRKYIRGAGGFSSNARKRGTYVAYANGKIASTRHFLWWRNYPDVDPGAHIFVPEKPARDSHSKENVALFAPLFTSVATMASVIVTAISVLNNNKSNNSDK